MNEKDKSKATILEHALSFASAQARDAYLQGACGDDAELRARMDALVKAHLAAGDFLEAGALGAATTLVTPTVAEEGPGTVIGRYKLLEKIGEGGFGVVYVAEQREPVKRRVALKILKLGMDTRQVVARFEAERQALALMDHPNIAKVLDAGTTDTGRPYFVMELVKGIPITKYCDQEKLSTQQRLDLFIKVCHAIQHAHQKGIIHRDIKPSNILVTLHDGVAVPKVIDFGIAKATQGELTDKTVYTQFQQFIGTPAYMSPEQAEMSGLDVDTRSDIYSLGVLLYELLTGSTPFDTKELVESGLDEMRKIIREREPVRPSTRLTQQSAQSKSQIANHNSQIPSDLDWIVMKCLEKDRTRRYETANGVAMDVQRHLSNEPVIARPPSAAYRARKAIRRNKIVFAAAGAVAGALVAGTIIASWQALRAEAARRKAIAAQNVATEQSRLAEQARQKAEAEAYAADISAIGRDLASLNVGNARRLLERYRPKPGQRDLRGWEWRYLWRQCRSDAKLLHLAQLNRAGGEVTVSVSPDGRWLAVYEAPGGPVSVLDISTPLAPRIVAQLPVGGGFSAALAFSPRDPVLAYSDDGLRVTDPHSVHLFNYQTRTNQQTFRLSNRCVDFEFSQDGQRLVTLTGGYPGTISELTVWSVVDGKQISNFPALSDQEMPGRHRLAVIPDLSAAVWCAGRQHLHLTDLNTGTNRWTVATRSSSATFITVALSSDGKLLVSAEDGPDDMHPLIRLWDVETGQEFGQGVESPEESIATLMFLPDGKTLLSAASETIRFWDITDPAKVRPSGRALLGGEGPIRGGALLADGHTLLTGSNDGSVSVWDLNQRDLRVAPGARMDSKIWGFSPDGQSLVSVTKDGQVLSWYGPDFDSNTTLFRLSPDEVPPFGRFSPDVRWLFAATTNNHIRVWSLAERKPLGEFGSFPDPLFFESCSPDGRRIVVGHSIPNILEEWNVENFREIRSWSLDGAVFGSCFYSGDAVWQLKGTVDGSFTLTDLSSEAGNPHNLEIRQVNGCAFAPDRRFFGASSFLGYVSVWRADTFQPVATVGDRQGPCWLCGFSPDGRRVLTSGYGPRAHQLWDLETQRELLVFPGEYGAAFSPDGNVLACKDSGHWKFYRAPTLAEIDASEKAN